MFVHNNEILWCLRWPHEDCYKFYKVDVRCITSYTEKQNGSVRNHREAWWQTSWMMFFDRHREWQTRLKHGRHREREWQTSRESPGDSLVSAWSLHGEQSQRVEGCCGDDVFIWLQSSGRHACMVVRPAGKVGYPEVFWSSSRKNKYKFCAKQKHLKLNYTLIRNLTDDQLRSSSLGSIYFPDRNIPPV